MARKKATRSGPPPEVTKTWPKMVDIMGEEAWEQVKWFFAKEGRRGGLIGGRAKTQSKAEAARLNGKRGGRPPKKGKKS